ncbi:MAG: hypothetical protein AAF915_14895 [Cyanobacteria bacterium P01_D01_bin.50]
MIINDINYLETSNEEVFGGTWGNTVEVKKEVTAIDNTEIDFSATFDVDIFFDKQSNITSTTHLQGNQSILVFANNAIGDGSLAQAELSNNVVQDKGSFQSGALTAAVDM